jgi:hypothetical protein
VKPSVGIEKEKKMWVIPVAVFFVLSIFFAGRLGKEITELGIADITRWVVSIVGMVLYVKEKKKRGERLSFNFWATIFCTTMIFVPFLLVLVFVK